MKLHEYVAACVELSKAKFSADAGDEEGGRVAFGIGKVEQNLGGTWILFDHGNS